jgi:hypothetical protein
VGHAVPSTAVCHRFVVDDAAKQHAQTACSGGGNRLMSMMIRRPLASLPLFPPSHHRHHRRSLALNDTSPVVDTLNSRLYLRPFAPKCFAPLFGHSAFVVKQTSKIPDDYRWVLGVAVPLFCPGRRPGFFLLEKDAVIPLCRWTQTFKLLS